MLDNDRVFNPNSGLFVARAANGQKNKAVSSTSLIRKVEPPKVELYSEENGELTLVGKASSIESAMHVHLFARKRYVAVPSGNLG